MAGFDGMMKRAKRGVALGAVLVAVTSCSPADGEEASAPVEAPSNGVGARIINVEVTPVTLSDFVGYVRITGEVEAWHDVTVSAEESGAIVRFFVEKGSRVQEGQSIAKIDDEVLTTLVEEARVFSEIASVQFERQRQLWEDEGMGSEIAYLQAKAASLAAQARLRTLETRLRRTVVRAPVTGLFEDDLLEVGEMASAGVPVARIVAVRRVKIAAGVPERYSPSIGTGDGAIVEMDVFPGRRFEGVISFVGASVDERNRTVPIEIALDNPDRLLKPRMIANVQVELERLVSVVVVPQDVVVRTEDGFQVYVVDEFDGAPIAVARSVRLGPSYANRVVIDEGLAVGDQLVTLGHRLVDHQSRVRVVNADGGTR